jgi:hypothetical protein
MRCGVTRAPPFVRQLSGERWNERLAPYVAQLVERRGKPRSTAHAVHFLSRSSPEAHLRMYTSSSTPPTTVSRNPMLPSLRYNIRALTGAEDGGRK